MTLRRTVVRPSSELARLALAAGVIGGFALTGTASAHHPDKTLRGGKADISANAVDVTDVGSVSERLIGGQHGGSVGHLPSKRENVELVGKLELTGQFGNVLPEQIADLSVFEDTAYLNSWSDPECTRGGTYIADIHRPSAPKEIGFIPALPGTFHGEGAQVISVKTKFFKGDLLAVNNEFCADEPTVGAGYSGPSLGATGEPAIGAKGEKLEATAVFDGWGYGHVYENGAGKLRHVGAFAIEEALDPRFAFGFGDLSIHEFATAPHGNLAFSAYYAGGARVFSFGPGGLQEVGAFIDKGGNNFWGVEALQDKHGQNMFATSDRDFGLYLFRYTGRAGHGH
jgi:hypothetical protein